MSLMTAGYAVTFATSDDPNSPHGTTRYTACPTLAAEAAEAFADVTETLVIGPRHDADECANCAGYIPSDLSGLRA
jgi:hypothetical protein